MHFIWEITQFFVLFIFNKMEGENKPPGGMRKHEKRGRDMHYMNGCGGELR